MTDLTDMAAEEAVWRDHLRAPEQPLFNPEQVLTHFRASLTHQIARYTRELDDAWLSDLIDLYGGYTDAYRWVATAVDNFIASGIGHTQVALAALKQTLADQLRAQPAESVSRRDIMHSQGVDSATRWMLARLKELQNA